MTKFWATFVAQELINKVKIKVLRNLGQLQTMAKAITRKVVSSVVPSEGVDSKFMTLIVDKIIMKW